MIHFRLGRLLPILIYSVVFCGCEVSADTVKLTLPASFVSREESLVADAYDLALLDQLAALHPEIEQAGQRKEIKFDDPQAGMIASPAEMDRDERVPLITSRIPGSWMAVLVLFVLSMVGRMIWRNI